MCGIVGRVGFSEHLSGIIEAMSRALYHRGPDGSGIWVDDALSVGLGHRRLAIVDLSSSGNQPMISAKGRYIVVFNGEIYNHRELRRRLDYPWRGHSDTEVILAAIQQWGLEKTLPELVGMFAFGVWDTLEKTLHLVRDRMGEKPLYYGWREEIFLFGSELKAIKAGCLGGLEINPDALALYLRYLYVPAPYSIYQNVFKLPAGYVLSIDAQGKKIDLKPWWQLNEAVRKGKETLIQSEAEACYLVETALRESIRGQSSADVPLGALLSGGIDSSLIVALMQSELKAPVQTFTIGFQEAAYNEAGYAKAVAAHLGTEHRELYVTPQEAQQVISLMPQIYDEPFADSSQIPTFFVAQLTKKTVTVALTGDGGDELFGGYNRYFWGQRIWRKIAWLPAPWRRLLGEALLRVAPCHWEKVHKLADRLRHVQDLDDLYLSLVSEWAHPEQVLLSGKEADHFLQDRKSWPAFVSGEERMMFLDSMTYLPEDICTKVDRASMAVSLETRAPFLDHRLVELAWRLPLSMKIRQSQGKWILRKIVHQYVPKSLVERPKQGFGVPIASWLRGPLRPWAESLLDPERLAVEGFFKPEIVARIWRQHMQGECNVQHKLWALLMFQAWLAQDQRG